MPNTKKSPANNTAGDKATDQLNKSMLTSEDTTRLHAQTATALLMCALTSAPAHVVIDVAGDMQQGDWPTAAHLAVWLATVAHCNDLAANNAQDTTPSVEVVADHLRRAGHLNDQTSAVILDAVGTVRGGRTLPPHTAYDLAASLKRYRLAQVLAATADALQVAATGSDDDVQRAMNYVAHLPRYVQRAGVVSHA